MQDLALEQIGHGREPDVRVRPHVHALPGRERDRPEVIEEDERTDALARERGQHAPHLEPAEVARAPSESVCSIAPALGPSVPASLIRPMPSA